jgi:hypothetical protein
MLRAKPRPYIDPMKCVVQRPSRRDLRMKAICLADNEPIFLLHATHPPFGDEIPPKSLISKANNVLINFCITLLSQ